jgi:hypothetical protein
MNFLNRYRRQYQLHGKEKEQTSLVSDLGFDGAECTIYRPPTGKELNPELFLLVQPRTPKAQLSESLNKIQIWTLIATDDVKHDLTGRIFVKYQVVPLILLFLREQLKMKENDGVLFEKAAKILQQCTSFHDRHTSKQEKFSKDMIMQLVKCNGVKLVSAALDRYNNDTSRKRRRSLFTTLWTTLLNVASCDKAVSLLKLPKPAFQQQELLLLDTVVRYLERAEAEVLAFWMERLFIALHFFLQFNGEPDADARELLAKNSMINELLQSIMEGRRQLAVKDPCVTALAMSLFLVCLRDGTKPIQEQDPRRQHQYDALRKSIDMNRLTQFTVRAMKAFPTSQIIQESGCMILNHIPPIYRISQCYEGALFIPSSCGAMDDEDASATSNVLSSVVGPCWVYSPWQEEQL